MIKRIPVKRIPIKFSKNDKYESIFKTLSNEKKQKEIVQISVNYNNLVSRFNYLSGYHSLSIKQPTKHKNWKHFEKLYELCVENDWDYKLFLQCQFERAKKHWTKSKFKFPLPNMLCSDKSIEYFKNWVKDRTEKYENDLAKVELFKAKKSNSTRQRIITDIVNSVESIVYYIDKNKSSESKAVRIYHNWESYSPSYLWTIPWFRKFADELKTVSPDCPSLTALFLEWNMIQRSKSLQDLITKTTKIMESKFNMPDNIAI